MDGDSSRKDDETGDPPAPAAIEPVSKEQASVQDENPQGVPEEKPDSKHPFLLKNQHGKLYSRGKAMNIEEKRRVAVIYNRHVLEARQNHRVGPVIAHVAKEAKVSKATVYKVREELKKQGDVIPAKKPSRKRGIGAVALSPEDKALLLRLREEDCFRTRKSYCDELLLQRGTVVSEGTIGRFFKIPNEGDTFAIATADYDTLRLLGNNKIVYKNFHPAFQRMCNYVGKSRKCYKHFKEKFDELEKELQAISKTDDPDDNHDSDEDQNEGSRSTDFSSGV